MDLIYRIRKIFTVLSAEIICLIPRTDGRVFSCRLGQYQRDKPGGDEEAGAERNEIGHGADPPGGAGRSSLGFAGFVPAVIFLIFQ
ncbi:MAG: hypothetical protein H3C28_01890 [Sphingomonadales bacterium]|nr:hypothetical protein [Sphingomonadales bacterium]